MIYSDLLSNIETVDQAREFISEIDMLLDSLFKTQNGFEEGLNAISASHSQMLKEALLKNNIQASSPSIISEYLHALKEEIRKLKTIKLALAFEPRQHTIDNLFTWVSQNLGSGIILDIKLDKTILGGTIVELEGKYQDFSLKKKLEELFGRKREEIMRSY